MTLTQGAIPGILVPGLTHPSELITAPDGYHYEEATPGVWSLVADPGFFRDSRGRGDIYEPFNRPSAW